ncbi:MAG: hypothetical protein H7Y86_06905 [Rhizobacter sp.]|nr:hypothetical protein [Ferruginibacter sp.]
MKNTALIFLFFCLTSKLFGQSKTSELENIIKSIDNSWELKIDTPRKDQNSFILNGQKVEFLTVTKGKQEITFCLSQSFGEKTEISIRKAQNLASCGAIGLNEKNQIAKMGDLFIFLSIYPCWSEYSDAEKEFIQRIFTKLKSKV